MATFKVGQRVRVIAAEPHSDVMMEGLIGKETVIKGPLTCLWGSLVHEVEPLSATGAHWFCAPEHLAPITDPKADEFIERIKKLGNEPMPLVKEPIHA